MTPAPEPIPETLAALLKPGDTAKLVRPGLTRYLHCVAPGSFVITLTAEKPPGASVEPLAETYARLWHELFTAPDGQQEAVMASVESRLPRQCGCLSHWSSWKREHPPVFGAEWIPWLWAAKAEIRRRQGKPGITLEEARAFYEKESPLPHA